MGSSLNELIAFVRDQAGHHEITISRKTLIEDDLGVTGGDAEDLVVAFGQKFNVEISNFKFQRYFNDEPGIFNIGRSVEPFTIGDLEKAMIAGRLDEEVINS